jgi:hypothetical protein
MIQTNRSLDLGSANILTQRRRPSHDSRDFQIHSLENEQKTGLQCCQIIY